MSTFSSAMRERIVAEARSWLGTPYHHLGDVKGVGVDCAMLLVRVFASVGLLPLDLDPRPYPANWHMHRSEERYLGWLAVYAQAQASVAVEPGDVMAYHFGRTFSHAGICIGAGELLHAWRPSGCVTVSRLDDADLVERREGVPRTAMHWRLNALLEA